MSSFKAVLVNGCELVIMSQKMTETLTLGDYMNIRRSSTVRSLLFREIRISGANQSSVISNRPTFHCQDCWFSSRVGIYDVLGVLL